MKRNRILACGAAALLSMATMALPTVAGATHLPKAPKAPKAPKVKAGTTWTVEAEAGLVCVPVSFERRRLVSIEEGDIQLVGTWAKSTTSVTVSYAGEDFTFNYARTTGYSGVIPVIGIPVALVSGTPCRPTALPIP
jgi:hypothetical protein